MADTQDKPIDKNAVPKSIRFPVERFRSQSDFKMHQMACDQMDAGINSDFYIKKVNAGFVLDENGARKQFFMK